MGTLLYFFGYALPNFPATKTGKSMRCNDEKEDTPIYGSEMRPGAHRKKVDPHDWLDINGPEKGERESEKKGEKRKFYHLRFGRRTRWCEKRQGAMFGTLFLFQYACGSLFFSVVFSPEEGRLEIRLLYNYYETYYLNNIMSRHNNLKIGVGGTLVKIKCISHLFNTFNTSSSFSS